MDTRQAKVQFWMLNAASLLGQLAISMVNLALVYYLRYTLGASAGVVGLAASTYTGVYLACCLAFGGFYQRFRPYVVVCISLLGMGLSMVLVTCSDSIPLVFTFLVLYGFFMSMLWPQVEAWITRGAEGEREYIHDLERNDGAVDHSTPLRYDSWIAVFVVYSALSVVLNIFPMYAGEVAGMGETTSGFLLLLRGLATCAAFMTLGRMRFWQFKAWMIYLAQGMFVVLALVFHSASTPLSTGIFFILFGIVFAMCYSFSIFHAAAGALDRGRRMVIHECVLTVGQVVGASFGGVIYQSMGYSDVLLFLAATAALLLAVQVAVHVLRRRA